MPDAIWIDRSDALPELLAALQAQPSIGVDTEFLRERTFFPRLCVLQIAAAGRAWCIDALESGNLAALVPALTADSTRKILHAARQDLEAFYLTSRRIIAPLFDTQIAAACVGLKPQIGYAELANLLLGVTVTKGQTRTDWSRRPLSRAQLEYAAADVLHLQEMAERLSARLRELGREHWALEDCRALQDRALYEPDASRAWTRLRGLAQLAPRARSRAKAVAAWRERTAHARNLPRSWILDDGAILALASADPRTPAALREMRLAHGGLDPELADELLEALRADAAVDPLDMQPGRELRPTAEQRSTAERLGKIVDAHAALLGVSAEVLATRGELRALSQGEQDIGALSGWRRAEIGERLLEAL